MRSTEAAEWGRSMSRVATVWSFNISSIFGYMRIMYNTQHTETIFAGLCNRIVLCCVHDGSFESVYQVMGIVLFWKSLCTALLLQLYSVQICAQYICVSSMRFTFYLCGVRALASSSLTVCFYCHQSAPLPIDSPFSVVNWRPSRDSTHDAMMQAANDRQIIIIPGLSSIKCVCVWCT